MRNLTIVFGLLFLLSACATNAPPKAKYEAFCKTHARQVGLSGSPDEQAPYTDCMHIKGMHEIEVKELQ